MRIPEHDPFRFREAALPEAKNEPKAPRSGPSPRHGAESVDRIELSGQARGAGELLQSGGVSLDSRAERLAAIADMVANGAYHVSSESILGGLIRSALLEK